MRIDFAQLDHVHPTLRALLADLEEQTSLEFTNTSNYRPGNGGVHGQIPLRGWDLRMRDSGVGFAIEALINRRWAYDPHRPAKACALLHGDGANLQVQVHPNTVFVGEQGRRRPRAVFRGC